MKIAVIENEVSSVHSVLEKSNPDNDWDTSFFTNAGDFLKDYQTDYDVVLIDHNNLPDKNIKEEDLIVKISEDMDADIGLMNESSNFFNGSSERLIKNQYVNALIDKTDPDSMLNWLNYVTVKKRLNMSINKESWIYSELISNSNGCTIEVKNDITVLGISKILSRKKIDQISQSILSLNKKVILYYTDAITHINSRHIGMLVAFWDNIEHKKGGKIAFWLAGTGENSKELTDFLNMHLLFPAYYELGEAISYINSNTKSKRTNNVYAKQAVA